MNERELLAAHGELTEDVARYARAHRILGGHGDGTGAPALVPGWLVPRLNRFAESLRYPVTYRDLTSKGSIGETDAMYNVSEYRPQGISIQRGMTPASTARTTCHELAHAIGNEDRFGGDFARMLYCAGISGEDGTLEEVQAETCAALCARALRIDQGDEFSLWYLASTAAHRGRRLLAEARPEGIRRAEVILKGIA